MSTGPVLGIQPVTSHSVVKHPTDWANPAVVTQKNAFLLFWCLYKHGYYNNIINYFL